MDSDTRGVRVQAGGWGRQWADKDTYILTKSIKGKKVQLN